MYLNYLGLKDILTKISEDNYPQINDFESLPTEEQYSVLLALDAQLIRDMGPLGYQLTWKGWEYYYKLCSVPDKLLKSKDFILNFEKNNP